MDHLVSSTVARAGGPAKELDLDAARHAFETKLWGPFAVVQAADVGRSIVLLSGVAASTLIRGGAATAAVNGAVEALVRTLAVEVAPVRVNVVSPRHHRHAHVARHGRRPARVDVHTAGGVAAGGPRRLGGRRRERHLAPAHERVRDRHRPSRGRRPSARGAVNTQDRGG
ncbi:MAG: SDR family oxidoreductase [Actinobacteria bacterium]|nr:MAG: SDR family oxidoreductase [Actinomycetota bacterium]